MTKHQMERLVNCNKSELKDKNLTEKELEALLCMKKKCILQRKKVYYQNRKA